MTKTSSDILFSVASAIKHNVAYHEGRVASCQLIIDVIDKHGKRWPKLRFIQACGLKPFTTVGGQVACA